MRCFISLAGKGWCFEMHTKVLTSVLRMSCRVYGLLLPLYPSTLRCQFGSDMADVFEEQIRGECAQSGFTGVARIWSCVATDVIQNAVWMEFQWTRAGRPVVSLTVVLRSF